MPRPLSRNQIDRLGVEDLDLLERVRASYDPAMATFEGVLREHLSLSVTSRLKTVGTILDKLRREKTRLSTMQDIAGVRYVEEMTLSQQDLVVAKIVKAFPSARVVDRRIHSSYGYRAVHLVVDVDGCPVEVQVRTHLQNSWAQIAEAIADRVGRGLRYGDIPTGSEQFAEGLAECVRPDRCLRSICQRTRFLGGSAGGRATVFRGHARSRGGLRGHARVLSPREGQTRKGPT